MLTYHSFLGLANEDAMTRTTQTVGSLLDGDDFRQMFAAGQSCLASNVDIVNSLNVFPVPDGDTGTNMLLTLKAANEEFAGLEGAGAGMVSKAMARGMLMGARGNSGVILSQFLQGWAQRLQGTDTFGGPEMADALTSATEAAYKAVGSPVEGTILTVVKEAARAAREAVAGGEKEPLQVWERACHGARTALSETPDLLPVLKEAGVVDAGGLGLVAIMEGAAGYLRGEEVGALDVQVGQVVPSASFLASTEEEAYGYCTQFLLQGADLDVETVRNQMSGMAGSTVVVGDASAVKVHVHTNDPGPVISYAVSLGSINDVKIDNIDDQHQEFLELHRERQQGIVPLGVVAVALGEGIQRIFRELGAVGIVPGGQTMNPSTRELVDVAARAGAAGVIVLPNNPNVVSAARQAASVSPKPLHVLPTISIPQGVAALLAFDPDLDVAANLDQMKEAMSSSRSGEVTVAVRSASVNGHRVRRGEAIALMDGELVAASRSIPEVLKKLCRHAGPSAGALITLYWGADTQEGDAREVAEKVRAWCPGVEVELVYGGQPYYNYLISIE